MSNLQKIAFQGVPGAYSHLSCQAFCPDWEPVAYDSFSGMLRAVQNGECSYAMVPVENSTAGRVADIHHMLPESGLHIIAEHFQPVKPSQMFYPVNDRFQTNLRVLKVTGFKEFINTFDL